MVITASEARAQLFPLIEQVNTDSVPVIITSKKGNAVLLSESEWESMVETMYLLRTTANRERLTRSKEELKAGNLYEYELPIAKATQGKKALLQAKEIALVNKTPATKKNRASAKVATKAKKKSLG
jgi:antitoxin YefM